MKINYILNDDNTIKSFTIQPFNEELPFIEIDNDYQIKLDLDKIIDNQLVIFEGEDPQEIMVRKWTRITELKLLLANSDYQAIKFSEGELTEEEYAPIREQRKAWRIEINELQK